MTLRLASTLVVCLAALSGRAIAQFEFEEAPIRYQATPVHTPVTALQKSLDAGQTQLEHDDRRGYLAALLARLEIPVESQVLVFSKTSLQTRRISPRTPRAIYFNDDTYVGWVPGGDLIEIMSTDPQQGEIFYTLDQTLEKNPQVIRDQDRCLACHVSGRTQRVPGALVRSVFPDPSGHPQLASGTFTTDHTSPFEERWGGWYVTGTHGGMRHLGNRVTGAEESRATFDREAGANVVELGNRIDSRVYLTPHSDLVALMLLEHQTQTHNFLTLASYECRSANHYDTTMNPLLDRPADYVSDTTRRRIDSVAEKLVHALLFVDEFALTAPVQGTTSFAADFAKRGPRDSRGRSLRELDLTTRLLRYPCSYLIYSAQFDQLPRPVKSRVVLRLHDVLTGHDTTKPFRHLSTEDRQAILEILTETKPGLWDLRAAADSKAG